MFALRYLALVALVIWLGGMIVVLLTGTDAVDLVRLVQRIALVCGGVLLVALCAMKLIGPPPAAFPVRALVVAAMLALAIGADAAPLLPRARLLTAVNTAAGLFLLSFYVRE